MPMIYINVVIYHSPTYILFPFTSHIYLKTIVIPYNFNIIKSVIKVKKKQKSKLEVGKNQTLYIFFSKVKLKWSKYNYVSVFYLNVIFLAYFR